MKLQPVFVFATAFCYLFLLQTAQADNSKGSVEFTHCGGPEFYAPPDQLVEMYPRTKEIATWCKLNATSIENFIKQRKDWHSPDSFSIFCISKTGTIMKTFEEKGKVAESILSEYKLTPPPDGLGSRKLTLYVKYPIVELRVDATEDGAIFSP
jgi:hypothetical protein